MTLKPSVSPDPAPAAELTTEAGKPVPENPVRGQPAAPREFGGRKDGTEPTRFGDWEKSGRCIDF